jgi:hypothetical protein
MPPGAGTNDWRLDNSFNFKLSPERSPHPTWGFHFGGQFLGCGDYDGEVSHKIPAMTASGHMRSGCFRQGRQTFLFHCEFHVLTLHNFTPPELALDACPLDFSQIASTQLLDGSP